MTEQEKQANDIPPLYINEREGKFGPFYTTKKLGGYLDVYLKENETPLVKYDRAYLEVGKAKNGSYFVDIDNKRVFINPEIRKGKFGNYLLGSPLPRIEKTEQTTTTKEETNAPVADRKSYQKLPRS